MRRVVLFCLLVLALAPLAACKREGSPPAAPAPDAAPAGASAPATDIRTAPVDLQDRVETTSDYIIGISYPESAARYPAVAAEMKRFAEAARADLLEAVRERRTGEDAPLYDLSLAFVELYRSDEVVAFGADGSIYTGGAHGAPLLARFVWLPRENRLLHAAELIPEARGWQVVSDFVREQLRTALSQRIDAAGMDPAERARLLRDALRLVEEGTRPEARSFELFEPMAGSGGKLGGLRFVFPPYQVGPYSDGTQTVEVPATVLRPLVAERYRGLFEA